MGNWADTLKQQIEKNLQDTREKDRRFFRIDEFKRNIERTDEFAAHCRDCLRQKSTISAAVDNLWEAVETPGKKRREYDRLISSLSKHMQKQHGFYPPYHFSYLFAFLGLLAGFAISYALATLFPAHSEIMYLTGLAVGIIVAYFWGSHKDRQIRVRNKVM